MTIHRVGVLMGGASAERSVSLASGAAVRRALEEKGYDVVAIDLEEEGDWAQQLKDAKLDAAFLALHGQLGEDGCVQGLCEVLGIPYTGSSVLSSALAMDKAKAKEMFRQYNVPTPPHYVFEGHHAIDEIEHVHGSFGFPVVVKPRSGGSSIGVHKVDSFEQLASAVKKAREEDADVIVERYIRGKEINVALLNGRILGAIEVVPGNEMYDYEAKYQPGKSEYFLPARVAPTRFAGLLNLAESAAKSLDCSGACRVDMLVTEGENEYVLEVNTLPGMTETSLLPKIAEAAGYPFADLIEAILESATLHVARKRVSAAPAAKSGTRPVIGMTDQQRLARAV